MVLVAFLALNLGFARLFLKADPFFGFATIYSECYSESRFNTLRPGMSPAQVEAIMGPPLQKAPWDGPAKSQDSVIWIYSTRLDYTANYWRR